MTSNNSQKSRARRVSSLVRSHFRRRLTHLTFSILTKARRIVARGCGEESESRRRRWQTIVRVCLSRHHQLALSAVVMFPSFYFMKHDRWANVLFLHWKVPKELQCILEEHVAPFELDRTEDGSVWIGLIFLTEQNVGISLLPRIAPWNSFTHHGINVRTYVKGLPSSSHPEERDGTHQSSTAGIHFASLECDHRFVSHMAGYFGMPYQIATMFRWYESEKADPSNGESAPRSTVGSDELVIKAHSEVKRFHIASQRLSWGNSLLQVLLSYFLDKIPLHNTKLLRYEQDPYGSRTKTDKPTMGINHTSTTFSVACEWERCDKPAPDTNLAKFLVERYHAYTFKYGCRLRGDVEHEPWPVEIAVLNKLSITNISSYETKPLQPIIEYMATHAPDSVLYSPGVGPINFKMLRNV